MRQDEGSLMAYGAYLIVEPLKAEDRTASGLYLPEQSMKKACVGKVLSIGRGKVLENGQLVSPALKIGDYVFFSEYGGTEIEFRGNKYKVLLEEEIFGKVLYV